MQGCLRLIDKVKVSLALDINLGGSLVHKLDLLAIGDACVIVAIFSSFHVTGEGLERTRTVNSDPLGNSHVPLTP
jgi:hypothetical protein